MDEEGVWHAGVREGRGEESADTPAALTPSGELIFSTRRGECMCREGGGMGGSVCAEERGCTGLLTTTHLLDLTSVMASSPLIL